MNSCELQALQQPISNDAKLLYCIGLRPDADLQNGLCPPLVYKQLLALLNGKEQKYSLGRQLNTLIKELVDAGLANFSEAIEENRSFNGKQLILPLVPINKDDYEQLHMQWQNMQLNWKPHQQLYQDLSKLVGIIDSQYTDDELGDFVAYWLGRPEANFSQFQWTQKFVFNIKKKRLAFGYKPTQKVGNQVVTTKAGISINSNAKKLVEKYGGKH